VITGVGDCAAALAWAPALPAGVSAELCAILLKEAMQVFAVVQFLSPVMTVYAFALVF
jgi:mitochondrial fission protein ELM1